jgi:hypothetical protein
MPAQVGVVFGHHDEVPLTDLHEPLASGAHVSLPCRVWLHRNDHLVVERGQRGHAAHATNAITTAMVTTTSTMSTVDRCPVRNGLNPTRAWYGSPGAASWRRPHRR